MIITLIGILFFVWFALPLLAYGRLNIGNGTGLFLSLLLILIGAFWAKFCLAVQTMWKMAIGKAVIIGVCACALAIAITAAIETGFIISATAKKPEKSATLVVLGCKVNGDKPSLMLRNRIDAAEKYLKENPDAKCIVSGGKGTDEGISEAECMRRELINRGIAPERIFSEDKSTSTRENLAFSLEIAKQNNLSESIAIVTNNFHCYRASRVAAALDLSYGAVPARTQFWLMPTYYVRELFGILYEWVF